MAVYRVWIDGCDPIDIPSDRPELAVVKACGFHGVPYESYKPNERPDHAPDDFVFCLDLGDRGSLALGAAIAGVRKLPENEPTESLCV